MTEKLLAPAYGDDEASVYAYTEPIVASLMGTRAIPLTPTTAAFSGSVSVASLTASGGISGGSGAFTSNVTVGGTLGVTGNAALGGTLDLTGAATLHSTLGVTGLSTLASASLSGTLGVVGLSTLTGGFASGAASSVTGTLTATGDLLAQDATPTVAFQVHVATGAQYARIGSSGTPLLLGDIQNNRVTIGQGTDPAVTNERLSVLGGPLVAGYDNDQSFFLKRASTAGFFAFGTSAGANPGLVVKDTSGTQILFLAPVSGGQGLIVGTDTTFAASENFKVMGGSRLQGAVTVTTGGLTVTAGGLTVSAGGLGVTGSAAFNSGVSIVAGGLTVIAGGSAITGGVLNTQTANTTSNGLQTKRSGGTSWTELYQGGDDNGYLQNSGGSFINFRTAGHWIPGADGSQNLGEVAHRWGTVYATVGTINTSSREAKIRIAPFPPALALQIALATNLVTFRYQQLPDFPMAGFIAEDAPHELLSPDRASAHPQTLAAIALGAVQALAARITALEAPRA